MGEYKRIFLLLLIMLAVTVAIGGVAIGVLYRTAFNEERSRLVETAQSQARLIEAMARFDQAYSHAFPGGAKQATLAQLSDAHAHYVGFGETGEFTLAKRDGDNIEFLLSHRHGGLDSRDFQEVPHVLAHEGRLTQVFLNLLINAAQAIEKGDPERNEIQVRLWQDGDEVLAEVKDTGKGIDPADLPYVFEPFFTTKERGVGTGLGLSISNNIVTSLGGRLEVDSTVGGGTRFVLRLPVAEPLAGTRPTSTPDKVAMQS